MTCLKFIFSWVLKNNTLKCQKFSKDTWVTLLSSIGLLTLWAALLKNSVHFKWYFVLHSAVRSGNLVSALIRNDCLFGGYMLFMVILYELEFLLNSKKFFWSLSRIYTRQLCRPIFEMLQANSSKNSLQCNDFSDFEKSVDWLQILARFLLGFCLKFLRFWVGWQNRRV